MARDGHLILGRWRLVAGAAWRSGVVAGAAGTGAGRRCWLRLCVSSRDLFVGGLDPLRDQPVGPRVVPLEVRRSCVISSRGVDEPLSADLSVTQTWLCLTERSDVYALGAVVCSPEFVEELHGDLQSSWYW